MPGRGSVAHQQMLAVPVADTPDLRESFARSDANADGRLDLWEVKRMLAAQGFADADEGYLAELIAIFDRDGDGCIDRSEFPQLYAMVDREVWAPPPPSPSLSSPPPPPPPDGGAHAAPPPPPADSQVLPDTHPNMPPRDSLKEAPGSARARGEYAVAPPQPVRPLTGERPGGRSACGAWAKKRAVARFLGLLIGVVLPLACTVLLWAIGLMHDRAMDLHDLCECISSSEASRCSVLLPPV